MTTTLSGKNGELSFDGTTVQITKKRLFGGGTQQFPVSSLQAVNFKGGTKLTIGYIQFVTSGQSAMPAPRLSDTAANKEFYREPNVVSFGGRSTADFEAIRDEVQAAMHAARSAAAAPATAPSAGGVADELKKLAELRDSGVLSAEEFDAEKSRLLGR